MYAVNLCLFGTDDGGAAESAEETSNQFEGIDADIVERVLKESQESDNESDDSSEENGETGDAATEDPDNTVTGGDTDDSTESNEDGASDDGEKSDEKEASGDESAEDKKPEESIPYARFKQLVEEKNKLAAELETAKKNTVPKQQIESPAAQLTKIKTDPKIISAVEKAVRENAKKICNLSDDDIESLEYDDAPDRKVQWEAALSLSRSEAWKFIDSEVANRNAQQQQLLKIHDTVIKDYTDFEAAEKQDANVDKVRSFAIGDYFKAKPEFEQAAIADAWNRIERQVCSPQDVLLVKHYYSDAKKAYYDKNPVTTTVTNKKSNAQKLKQAGKLPRVDNIKGDTTNKTMNLSQMKVLLDQGKWDEIPEKYQKMLLNG